MRSRRRSEAAALIALVLSLAVMVGTPAAVAVGLFDQDEAEPVGSRSSALASVATSTSPDRVERGARPVGLTIPDLEVSTSVLPVGVTSGGGVVVPENIALTGWYRFGSRPGDRTGSTVIVGHRDGRESGAGALYGLEQLEPGALVSVVDADWLRWDYRVVARERFAKDAAPFDDLFAEDGRPRLTLISCGGRFDADTGSYEENVVVTAVLEGGEPS